MAITKVSPDLLDLDAGITITTADNSDNIALVSTDADANTGPNISFWRNSGSPADQDKIGDINWYAENDAGEKTHIVNVRAHIQDVSDGSEDARFLLQTIVGGATETSRLELLPTETVINQDSKDLDFRVESDDNANMLFVDGGNDRVGIGTASPSYPLNLYGTETGEGTVKGQLGIQSTTAYGSSPQAGITFTNEHTSGSQAIMGGIRVGKSNTTDTNYSGFMAFDVRNHGAVAFEAMRIDSTGVLTSKSHVVTGIDNTAFEVKTNHGGNPSALRVAGSGSINGISGSFQNFYALNVMQDSGSTNSIYAAGSIKTDGNIVMGTSGKGISFGATSDTAGMTSELLDDYEEGTWTPTFKDLGGNLATLSTANGRYTKIGRQVILNFQVAVSNKGSMTGSYLHMGDLPFSHPTDAHNGSGTIDYFSNFDTNYSWLGFDTSSTGSVMWMVGVAAAGAASSIYIPTAAIGGNETFKGTIIYTVS